MQPRSDVGGRPEYLATDDERWRAFVASRPEATVFHQPAWARVLNRSYGFETFAFALLRPDGSIAAGLPIAVVGPFVTKRWVSLPFSDRCVPLGEHDDVERMLEALLLQAQERGIDGAEIRTRLTSAGADTAVRGVLHTLALAPDPDQLLRTFSKSQVQRNIVRAKREGVVVRRGERREDLCETFVSLHLRTRRRQGLPIQPRSFFERLWEEMIEPGHGFVQIAQVDDVPAAAAVFLHGGTTVTYKYGASAPEQLSRRPNHLVFWEAIRWACLNGYETLDFGRSDADNQGLRAFKSGWGTVEKELAYSTLGGSSSHPSPILMAGLASVIRHSPPWVCRALGKLLYRFAA